MTRALDAQVPDTVTNIVPVIVPDIVRDVAELTDWRRQVAELYAGVRASSPPEVGWQRWRTTRDALLRTHPQSPLLPDDGLRSSGLSYWPYDSSLRFELMIQPSDREERLYIPTGGDQHTDMSLVGRLKLPAPLSATVAVWRLNQYGGGLFIPLRDGTAGDGSYGGGRYLLDTAKGADLGATSAGLVVDLNFLYHPSCRYNPAWVCPLAPPGNTVAAPIRAGEKL